MVMVSNKRVHPRFTVVHTDYLSGVCADGSLHFSCEGLGKDTEDMRMVFLQCGCAGAD